MAVVLRGYRKDVLLVVAAGGALGSLARYLLAELLPHPPGGFAVATLLTNVLGGLGLGVLMAFVEHDRPPRLVRPFLGIGFFGGFTTMSTFALETVEALRHGHVGVAAAYVGSSLAASLVAVAVGFVGTDRVLRRFARGDRS
ncbi:fluoride efflux transporter FluC [Saccharomonospora glauca]|uniref:Fluoride-specific ion channel FluC n=1 Tax=Saccharomonospora glauca K62 TaxID=928724 RepID=I1D3Q1_9PSEU|nr:CrcB family protein [Saccharomonospora glauca]EIE99575.1 Integral membrane protein possibly involved in chromosome condensation [Saccharomonospora glauca K62]